MLHLTKIAFGCASVDVLRARLESRAERDRVFITTRFKPKRADELIGGSLYWIVNHRLCVRQPILEFTETPERRIAIHLGMPLVPVCSQPRRAHQGWRYLEADDAPADLAGDATGIDALPQKILDDLAALALI